MATEKNTASSTTIPGGKYLAADGKTFVNANGKPLKGNETDEKSDSTTSEAKAEKDAA